MTKSEIETRAREVWIKTSKDLESGPDHIIAFGQSIADEARAEVELQERRRQEIQDIANKHYIRAEKAESELSETKALLNGAKGSLGACRMREDKLIADIAEAQVRIKEADRILSYAACVKLRDNTEEWAQGLLDRLETYDATFLAQQEAPK